LRQSNSGAAPSQCAIRSESDAHFRKRKNRAPHSWPRKLHPTLAADQISEPGKVETCLVFKSNNLMKVV